MAPGHRAQPQPTHASGPAPDTRARARGLPLASLAAHRDCAPSLRLARPGPWACIQPNPGKRGDAGARRAQPPETETEAAEPTPRPHTRPEARANTARNKRWTPGGGLLRVDSVEVVPDDVLSAPLRWRVSKY
eukprot:1642541-Prymnesium_polylepis.1